MVIEDYMVVASPLRVDGKATRRIDVDLGEILTEIAAPAGAFKSCFVLYQTFITRDLLIDRSENSAGQSQLNEP
jgi:hypothetical protein